MDRLLEYAARHPLLAGGTVVLALALGLSSVLAGKSTVSDGFGLLGFASIGPIIAVMILGILR